MLTFDNPILPGFYPDPSVARAGEDYYLVTSTFDYFPGVPVFHSRDLITWTQIGHCLTRDSQLPLPGDGRADDQFAGAPGVHGGIYAPTIRHHAGRFYMVTTNVSSGRHFYVVAENPAGPWSEPIWIDDPEVPRYGIDPSLLFDDDGTVYFTCNGAEPAGIMQFVIDIETGKRLSPVRRISGSFLAKDVEGPHLYKIRGQYFLLTAEGGTEYGHLVAIGRSASPWGPFESCPHNPILTHRSKTSPIQCVGHADLFEAHDGSWWIVSLGVRPNGYPPAYHLGRETFLSPVTWTADGWPVVGENGQGMHQPTTTAPTFAAAPQVHETVFEDGFETPALGLKWNFMRNPDPAMWSLTARPGWLTLNGGAATLDTRQGPIAFIGRRQCHFDFEAEVTIDFAPSQGDEAGLCVEMNERHHYEIAVTHDGDSRQILVRRRIGALQAVVTTAQAPDGPIRLRIRASRDWYTFGFGSAMADTGSVVDIATGETRYLSTEVAGGFSGVYIAMYATGRGRPAGAPAYFDNFAYRVASRVG